MGRTWRSLGTTGSSVVPESITLSLSSVYGEGRSVCYLAAWIPWGKFNWECSYFSTVNFFPGGSNHPPSPEGQIILLFVARLPISPRGSPNSHLIRNISRSIRCYSWQPTSSHYTSELLNLTAVKEEIQATWEGNRTRPSPSLLCWYPWDLNEISNCLKTCALIISINVL